MKVGTLDVVSDEELAGLPTPVVRYLRASIAPGTLPAPGARLEMRGSIRLGKSWLPFKARQELDPHGDSVWRARVAGIVGGSDSYVAGRGRMSWKLLGLIPVVRAEGPDIDRSAAGRFGAEAFWVPTTLLPRFGVSWTNDCANVVTAHFRKDDIDIDLSLELYGSGLVRSAHLDRWGDADNAGRFGFHPFGVEVTDHATFDGLTIPSAGRAGWFHGTERWSEGEFIRYEITNLTLRY